MESAQDKYKLWGIALIVFLLILIPAEILLLKSNKSSPSLTQTTKLQKDTTATTQFRSFFIALEYDPNSKISTKIASGGLDIDPDGLKESPPSSASKFSYKVEIYSASGQLLSSGWMSKSKFVISDDSGKYQFRAYVPYVPGNTLKISSDDNKTLWSGQII